MNILLRIKRNPIKSFIVFLFLFVIFVFIYLFGIDNMEEKSVKDLNASKGPYQRVIYNSDFNNHKLSIVETESDKLIKLIITDKQSQNIFHLSLPVHKFETFNLNDSRIVELNPSEYSIFLIFEINDAGTSQNKIFVLKLVDELSLIETFKFSSSILFNSKENCLIGSKWVFLPYLRDYGRPGMYVPIGICISNKVIVKSLLNKESKALIKESFDEKIKARIGIKSQNGVTITAETYTAFMQQIDVLLGERILN